MGVSFKVNRTGSRYRPRPRHPRPAASADDDPGRALVPGRTDGEVDFLGSSEVNQPDCSVSSANFERNCIKQEHEASFSLNLFPDGFSIGKPTEGLLLPLLEDVPKLLHPYNRAARTLFSAIEYGWLPADILDDIPCKYFNGALICEVWDYRTCMSKWGNDDCHGDEFPKIQRIRLQIGTENVIKDMPSISDDSWTYSDILQAESQIIKALQPLLYLGPNPSLERLYRPPTSKQIDLGIHQGWLSRKQNDSLEVTRISTALPLKYNSTSGSSAVNLTSFVCPSTKDGTASSSPHAIPKSVPFPQENSMGKDVVVQPLPSVFRQSRCSASSRSFSAPNPKAIMSDILAVPNQHLEGSDVGQKDSATLSLSKRNRSNGASNPSNVCKRPKHGSISTEDVSQKHKPLKQGITGNIAQPKRKKDSQNTQHLRNGDRGNSQNETTEVNLGKIALPEMQRGYQSYHVDPKHSIKVEPTENVNFLRPKAEEDNEGHALDLHSKRICVPQLLPVIRSQPLHMQWSNVGPSSCEKSLRKNKAPLKRKLPLEPQDSVGGSAYLPSSSLGENRREPLGTPSSTNSSLSTIGSHKDKASTTSGPSILNASSNSFSISSLARLHKKPKNHTDVMSPNTKGIGSRTTSSGTGVSLSSTRFSVGTPLMQPLSGTNSDNDILERFSKIEMVVKSHGLNDKMIKVDKFHSRNSSFNYSLLPIHLFTVENTERFTTLTDKVCMSKSVLHGSRNTCKTRILNFIRERFNFNGNGLPLLVNESPIKLVLLEYEEPDDHTVDAELFYEDGEHIHLAVLPTLIQADLFAAQFISLMERDGYKLTDDQCQPASSNSINSYTTSSVHTELPCTTTNSSQSLNTTASGENIPNTSACLFQMQNIVSPASLPPRFSLTGPGLLEFASHLNMQRSLPLSQNALLGNQMPNSANYQKFLHMQQRQRQLYCPHSVLPDRLTNGGATSSITGVGGQVSSMGVAQMNDNLRQISGFNHLNHQIYNRDISQTQAAGSANLTHAHSLGMGVNVLNMPPLNLSTLNSDQLQQQRMQHRKLEWSLLLRQHLLSSPHHNSSASITQMSALTPTSPMQMSSESVSSHINSFIGNVGSPQLSAQTVLSSGSITNSPMELQCIKKTSTGAAFAAGS